MLRQLLLGLVICGMFGTQLADCAPYGREKREFNVQLDASFEEQIGADLSAALDGTLWRNEAGTASLHGTAKYEHHLDSAATMGNKNAPRVSASLRYRHD